MAVSGGRVRVTEAGTTLYTGVWPGLGTAGLPAGLAQVMAELTSCYQHCLDVEAANAPMDSLTTPVFPLVLGRKPQHLEAAPSNDSLEKENRAPVHLKYFRTTLKCNLWCRWRGWRTPC